MERSLSIQDAKQINLVDYLATLGHQPQKIRNSDYWYLSPLREEKTPSFKVNRQLNVWYDHGTGQGGDIIDFGTQYHRCQIKQFLERLSIIPTVPFSFHPQSSPGLLPSVPAVVAGEKKEPAYGKIIIQDVRPLADKSLSDYLHKRSIPVDIASRFCKEVDFLLYGRQHTVIGFPNNAGGYELRNENFKGSSSPKDISLQQGRRLDDLVVFEGFSTSFLFKRSTGRSKRPCQIA
ncbi:CHC2 zinc finger domain-containing protein [Deminuibacter soli]|uniref:CHC2 zinc finger domain-containing protein n=1 Tax=Deminuibacter soli TaxID=2291815 RepID=UPI001FEA374C|nr:CHC2 zinc finger domain-containing protein [Deminuibacter soli]